MAASVSITVDDIHQMFRLRRSGRAYDPTRNVSKADMIALFEAARWSPSAGNAQPWRYIYANKTEDPRAYSRLFDLLNVNNQEWAQYAPVLLMTAAVTMRLNAHGDLVQNTAALHDLGSANMAISLEAANRGLMAHMIGGFHLDAARELFPADTQPVCMMTIGYPGEPTLLTEISRAKDAAPRTRKPIDEFVSGL
jgi:nitroreductase